MYFWERIEVHGDRPALITTDLTLSYSDLARRADRFADGLRAGLPPGLVRPLVLLETRNEIEPVVALELRVRFSSMNRS